MRRIGVVALFVLCAVLVVVAGRWDANRDTEAQRKGMARIFADAKQSRVPDAWRITGSFRCLIYPQGGFPWAFELCFDPAGGLVETIDRRSGLPNVYTLRSQPSKASIHVESRALDAVLRQMDAFTPTAPRGPAVRPKLVFKPPPPALTIPTGSGIP